MDRVNALRFVFPIDGDVLTRFDGKVTDCGLVAEVSVLAESGQNVSINGVNAVFHQGVYSAPVCLEIGQNCIRVQTGSGLRQEAIVYYAEEPVGKYRLSVDDVIWCLRDLTKGAYHYHSIFDHQFFRIFYHLHEKYGAKTHMNLYYETNPSERDYFNLSMMTDKYRDEFIQNSDWLRLSFHARADQPPRPYVDADACQITEDIRVIHREIIRFAGEETLNHKELTIHFAECSREGIDAVAKQGICAIPGIFELPEEERQMPHDLNYYLALAQKAERLSHQKAGNGLNQLIEKHVATRCLWKDHQNGIVHFRYCSVMNKGSCSSLTLDLDAQFEHPGQRAFLELCIHEQYFYDDYLNYLPDYQQRVETVVRWAHEHGYKSVFLSQVLDELTNKNSAVG